MAGKELRQGSLDEALRLTDSIINKNYLSYLANENIYQVKDLKMEELAFNLQRHAKIFQLKKFVYDPDENFLHKLVSVVNTAYALKGTILTCIHSEGGSVDFYIGIIAKEEKGGAGEKDREALLHAFEGTITGNFIGSDIGSSLEGKELYNFYSAIDGDAICSVSVVPSLRNRGDNGIVSYVQGIENLVDSLRGKKYTLVTVADPVSSPDITEIRHGYENIYNYLSPFYKVTETTGNAKSVTLSETDTKNYVKGIMDGISRTQSRSESTVYSNGFNLGVSFVVSAGFQHSKQHGMTYGDSVTHQNTRSEQFGKAYAKTAGTGQTTSESTQIFIENRIIKSLLDKIEKNIERIDECEGYGAFHSATYVLADDKETALGAAGNFVSLMKGEHSCSQVSGINCWERKQAPAYKGNLDKEYTAFDKLLSCIRHFTHPSFQVNKDVTVSASALVSGPELCVQLGFPKKSVNGLTVMPVHPFGRNIGCSSKDALTLGRLFYMGQEEAGEVKIDIASLASHTFITGSTGTGKSNAVYGILRALLEKGIHFMVIEPAKGEYKDVFAVKGDIRVLGTNGQKTELLKINPFAFGEDIHVLEHIDRLIELFCVCWPMYAAMPAVLKEAVEEAYFMCGWDLDRSVNRFGERIFPAFSDLEISLENVIERSSYDEEVKSNYKGSLLTRVRSLTNGLNGQIFCSEAIEDAGLFDGNVIIDISRVGAADTKALLMGLLVVKLQEYRICHEKANTPLQHITVLEEAHHLLRKSSAGQGVEGNYIIDKSVEMLTNAIAEMRTYGEGFLIIDQAPALLDMAAIRNTNTKILFRTPDYNDRLLAGRAAGLNDGQIDEAAKFPLGIAAVYQNGWLEPVLCKFEKYKYENSFLFEKQDAETVSGLQKLRKELVKWMLYHRTGKTERPDFALIEKNLDRLPAASRWKIIIKQFLKEKDCLCVWEQYKFGALSELIVMVLGCEKKISPFLQTAADVKEMDAAMHGLQQMVFGETLSGGLQLELNHCFMKYYSKAGQDALKNYYEWDFQIRNRKG